MVAKVWRVYGRDGHRQRESFNSSKQYDFSRGADVRRICVLNADVTGTNDYAIIGIARNTHEECEGELRVQITDGIFKNSRTGKIEELHCVKI